MKTIGRWIFRMIAGAIRRREQPLVVAIAGSVGKTGTKEAVAAALATAERTVRKTVGNFNGEIGVPLTIMAGGAAPTSLWQWGMALLAGLGQLVVRRSYPRALVLELGADKPGDLQPLVKLTRPSIGVLTALTPEHLEFFDTLEAVVVEESVVVRLLPPSGTAILNIDDAESRKIRSALTCRVLTYGWDPQADVRIDQARLTTDDHGLPTGQVIKIAVGGSVIPVALPGVIGRHQAYPVAAAIAVTQACGDELFDVVQRLSAYRVPPGRMRVFAGVEGTVVIDDSYNASPAAMTAAITAIADLSVPGKKHLILGQMSELGSAATTWHDQVGQTLSPHQFDMIITVGTLAKRIGEAARRNGFPAAHIINVPTAAAAAAALRPHLTGGDAILVKGSHYPKPGYSGFVGEAVRILLADPVRDEGSLVQRS